MKCLELVYSFLLYRPYGSPYARPPYMSQAAYSAAQAGMAAYREGYTPPQSRPLAPGQYAAQNAHPYMTPQATLEQQELQRLKNLKAAIQAANRVMSITRVQYYLGVLVLGVSIPAVLLYYVNHTDVNMRLFSFRKRKLPAHGGRRK